MNYATIAQILTDATWDYTYNTQARESTMREYLATLNNTVFTEDDVRTAIGDDEQEIIALQGKQNKIVEEFAAKYIADRVAQAKVDCIYETVTFSIY